jgi:hypothetical protein
MLSAHPFASLVSQSPLRHVASLLSSPLCIGMFLTKSPLIHPPVFDLELMQEIFSSHRIYVRRGKIGADDIFACFALVPLIIQVVAVFLHVPLPNNLSHTTRVAAYYLLANTFYVVIWLVLLLCNLSLTFFSRNTRFFNPKKGHREWQFSSASYASILPTLGSADSPGSLGYSLVCSWFSWRRSSGSVSLNLSGRAR